MLTHKTCKECGITYEIVMFAKKSKYRYRSKCRICNNITGATFSIYKYPIAEMQKKAELNCRRILIEIQLGKPKCIKCNTFVNRRAKLCSNCKFIALREKYKQRDKRRSRTKSQRKIENLSGSYVRNLIFPYALRKEFNISGKDIPQDVMNLKRKQIQLLRTIR